MLIEQAVFTSAETDRTRGYQLASRSPGVSDSDARELTAWGPSHDSLIERPGERASTNFHKLASGAYCVSRTTLAGEEYSKRGAARIYTHMLILPTEVLAQFGNNPFAVLRAATALGALSVHEQVPGALEPLQLAGRAPAVDLAMLAQLACEPGPKAIAALVQAALAGDRLAVASRIPTELLLAGLFSLLPIECRPEFSFTTGLTPSSVRRVRLMGLPENRLKWRAIASDKVILLDLDDVDLADPTCWHGWAGCIGALLASGKLSLLAAELEKARPGFGLVDLDQLAEAVQAKLQSSSPEPPCAAAHQPLAPQAARSLDNSTSRQRSDAPHIRPASILSALEPRASASAVASLAHSLAGQPPKVLELLERIDDLVFSAIGGDERALTELEVLWPIAGQEIDEDLFEQSREQYLRCALSICGESVEGETKRPERALAAIEVLCVLFDE